MESKKINQLATELAPDLSDLTIIGDPTTGISKKITLSQMASLFTGTVEEYANLAAFPLVGVADTIYIALDTNVIYRWDSTSYVVLSPNIIASLVFSDANGFDGTISLVGSVATLTITTALTSGSVPFIGASGALTQDNANLFFDDTNNRLGINTNAPTTALDVFGSGIIGRINGTSTNNAFLGFSSAGTNKWSIGNVQSDHRFRIYNEATTSELISVLSTGEFGIGIANPTTKFHIDGAASALIANLDANVSVAKSISFRSDNSNRINLEVSGTESGSNAGADLFIRRYSDAGALIDTPLTITRSTGLATFSGAFVNTSDVAIIVSAAIPAINLRTPSSGRFTIATNYIAPDISSILVGTGSNTPSTEVIRIAHSTGALTFSGITNITNATASTSTTTGGLVVTGGVGIGGALFGTTASFSSTLAVTGAATFSSSVTSVGLLLNTGGYLGTRSIRAASDLLIFYGGTSGFNFTDSTNSTVLASISNSGAATFSKGISVGNATATTGGIQFPATAVAIANANNLDDYEEGTYTVTMTPQIGSITLNTDYNTGSYTKIGNRVLFSFRIDVLSVSSASGQLNISLPFLVSSGSPITAFRSVASLFIYDAVSTIISSFVSVIVQNTQNVTILIGNTTTGSDAAAQMKAGTQFHIQGQYVAA